MQLIVEFISTIAVTKITFLTPEDKTLKTGQQILCKSTMLATHSFMTGISPEENESGYNFRPPASAYFVFE